MFFRVLFVFCIRFVWTVALVFTSLLSIMYVEKGKRNLWKGIEVLYRPCWYKEKEFFNACVYRKSFSCIGMWVYREKYFLIYSDGCIVFANMHKKIETKRKEKERPWRSTCYGHKKHKSFVEGKHIFWKLVVDDKCLFY